jgi:iron complex outermembrane receptor protein
MSSRKAVVAALTFLLPIASAAAQTVCTPSAMPAVRVASRRWPAPLDRQVTLLGDNLTLRDGLNRLAAAADVRLSYVSELLPLDRMVCLAYRSVPAGEVLSDLLRGTSVEPVVAGADQVVLAPARRSATAAPDTTLDFRRTSVLDRVVVMGTATATPERATTVAMDVVSGNQLARQQSNSLAQMLDGSVPGVWMWQQSPTTLMARYGSMRGASSFGLSYPKIYIDGIEVANPLLVRQFDPSTIERLEVIRGPQGAALYGADANSGVINILTRHDGTGPNGQRLQIESTAGMSGSQFAPQGVLTQQHAASFHAGTTERSAGLGLNLSTLGAYIPGAFARSFAANGDVRLVGARSVFTGSARLLSEHAGSPANPVLPPIASIPSGGLISSKSQPNESGDAYARANHDAMHAGQTVAPPLGTAPFPSDTAATQSMREYTVGGTLAYSPNERWTHTFVLGVDGYRLANPAVSEGPLPSATDSALSAARGGSDRITARATSSATFGSVDRASTELTFTAEHSAAREESAVMSTTIAQRPDENLFGEASASGARLVGWTGNTGLLAQTNTAFRNRFFLTTGVRLERNTALVGSTRTSTLPMVGGAVVGDRGDVTLKVRAAYGKGIRPVQGAIRELGRSGHGATLAAYDLAPEQQAGIEAGADLFVGRTFGLHVTRFDQRATDLIQSVAVTMPARSSSRGPRYESQPDAPYVAYQLQNLGEISNRGWELQGSADFGRLTLTSALSLVDSRVQRLASGYSGDLRAGDRMLEVPARTTTVSGSWTGRGWFTSLTLARASDWTGYDRVAIADALTSGGVVPRDLVGDKLRGFWREYAGVTRVRASFSRDLLRGLSFVMTGDNLLGQQRGEPDNATVVPGRTVTAGLKAKF